MQFFKKSKVLVGVFSITVLSSFVSLVASADMITRQLEYGMSGSDVGAMQTFFAKDSTIYPQGLVTSYFGTMTKNAVINFQTKNNIAPAGRVGPATLPILNAAMNESLNGTTARQGSDVAPTIFGVTITNSGKMNSANLSWSTNEPAQGYVYYSSSPLTLYENVNSVTVTGANLASTNNNYMTYQNVVIPNVQVNTTYYYLIYTTDQDGNVSVYNSYFRVN
jgi:peptidoglycan hydrolase-like protein with peptidoglycan-binding domain